METITSGLAVLGDANRRRRRRRRRPRRRPRFVCPIQHLLLLAGLVLGHRCCARGRGTHACRIIRCRSSGACQHTFAWVGHSSTLVFIVGTIFCPNFGHHFGGLLCSNTIHSDDNKCAFNTTRCYKINTRLRGAAEIEGWFRGLCRGRFWKKNNKTGVVDCCRIMLVPCVGPGEGRGGRNGGRGGGRGRGRYVGERTRLRGGHGRDDILDDIHDDGWKLQRLQMSDGNKRMELEL